MKLVAQHTAIWYFIQDRTKKLDMNRRQSKWVKSRRKKAAAVKRLLLAEVK